MTPKEKAALKRTIEKLKPFVDSGLFGLKADSWHRWQHVKLFPLDTPGKERRDVCDVEAIQELETAAVQGDADAKLVLQWAALEMALAGAVLPATLDKYLDRQFTRPAKNGRKRIVYIERDEVIRDAVLDLELDGFTRYRVREGNRKSDDHHESACSLVAKALEALRVERMSESGVERLFRRPAAASSATSKTRSLASRAV